MHLPAPGDEATLRRAVAALHEGMLPRDRPLWQLYVVQGLDSGRSALVSKIHHAMVDGVSGVELFEVLMDLTPDGHAIRGRPPATTHPPSTAPQRLAEAVWDSAVELAETGTRGMRSLLSVAADPKGAISRVAQPLAVLANAGLQHVQRLPFNRALTGGRRLSWLTLSLADMRAVRAATGATLNDLVLSIVGEGVGTYLRETGQPPSARSLRAMVPVDVRRERRGGATRQPRVDRAGRDSVRRRPARTGGHCRIAYQTGEARRRRGLRRPRRIGRKPGTCRPLCGRTACVFTAQAS